MKFLTGEQVAEMLQISERQARALFRMEGFPCFRIGKSYRVDEADLKDYLYKTKEIKLDYSGT